MRETSLNHQGHKSKTLGVTHISSPASHISDSEMLGAQRNLQKVLPKTTRVPLVEWSESPQVALCLTLADCLHSAALCCTAAGVKP